jgi:hypothetical protein
VLPLFPETSKKKLVSFSRIAIVSILRKLALAILNHGLYESTRAQSLEVLANFAIQIVKFAIRIAKYPEWKIAFIWMTINMDQAEIRVFEIYLAILRPQKKENTAQCGSSFRSGQRIRRFHRPSWPNQHSERTRIWIGSRCSDYRQFKNLYILLET